MSQKSVVQRWQELNSDLADNVESQVNVIRRDKRFAKRTFQLIAVAATFVLGLIWLINNSGNVEPSESESSALSLTETQALQQLVLELDTARNSAIAFRDVGLISEYADELSPVYTFDRELIESMINDDIEIQGVKYKLLSVEQISLRRSGTSEFIRLNVKDTRSGYSQTIQGKSSLIPARPEGFWELELYRRAGTQKWTLWSVQKARELQP